MSDNKPWLQLKFGDDAAASGEYMIVTGNPYLTEQQTVLWRRAYIADENLGEYAWPKDMRIEFERLLGVPEFSPQPPTFNLVELMDDDQAANQPCAFGNLVEGHAVYCHNEGWLYAPRKCRRTWYTGGETRDEDCPGFVPNPRLDAMPVIPPTGGAT